MELTVLAGWPWTYMRLACIGRLRSIHGSLAGLVYLLLGDSCQAAFHRVTPAYSPKRLVCVGGFEPPTSPIRTERATKLRYTQKILGVTRRRPQEGYNPLPGSSPRILCTAATVCCLLAGRAKIGTLRIELRTEVSKTPVLPLYHVPW